MHTHPRDAPPLLYFYHLISATLGLYWAERLSSGVVRGQDTEIVTAFFAGTVPRTPATISVSEPRSQLC